MYLITVREMLADMKLGHPFSIQGITYNRKERTGGEPYHYPECLLLDAEGAGDPSSVPPPEGTRPPTAHEQGPPPLPKRNANHTQWYTRNVRLCQAGQPTIITRKIHPPLITIYNGKKDVP